MMDRYTIGASTEALKNRFGSEVPTDYSTRFNAGPAQALPVITNQTPGKIEMFHWGLMTPLSNGKSISSKLLSTNIEVIQNKASLKNAVSSRKCLIISDGFYLWNKIAKKRQVPYYFFTPAREVFCIAGFWEEYEDLENGNKSFTFNMITIPPNGRLSKFATHELPAIVKKSEEHNWLANDGHEINQYLDSDFHVKMVSHSVSPKIQDLGIDSAELIDNRPPADQMGNYTLFG